MFSLIVVTKRPLPDLRSSAATSSGLRPCVTRHGREYHVESGLYGTGPDGKLIQEEMWHAAATAEILGNDGAERVMAGGISGPPSRKSARPMTYSPRGFGGPGRNPLGDELRSTDSAL